MAVGAYEAGPEEETHLWEYLHVLLRRRSLVIAVALTVTALAAVRAFITSPAYAGIAQLLIERENPNVLSFKEVAEVDARDDYYQTQYKLLQSRVLARRTIEAMNLLADPQFGGPRTPEEIEAARSAAPGEAPVMEGAIDAFLARLSVQAVKSSRLVTVSFEASGPEMAAQVTNKLCQLYIQQTLEFRYQTSSDAGQWLGGQIEEQRRKVSAAELALQNVKEREGIVNIEERRTLLDQKLKELGSALTGLKTTRLEKEALYNQMRNAGNPEELPEVMRSPIVQSLRIELASLERQQAQLLERYLDQHPEVIRVKNQIQETRKKIGGESQRVIRAAENDYKAAAAQEASVSSALEATKAEILDLSRRGGVQYDSLKRELEASKTVLDSLLSRSKQTDVAQELKSSNIRIVDPAVVPRRPVRPRPLRETLLGLLVGLGVGVGLAFFLDYLDNTLKTPEDVRARLGAPLLGVIPEMKESADLVVLSPRVQAPFAEGYRVIRTALNYSWPEPAPRIVVVTSTAPGEGKTLTSCNLALTFAAMDGKVLLIDCDLRKPQAHALMRARKSPGLSDILVGKSKPSDSIQRLAGTNLSILPAGTHVPSPADLMTNRVMRGFLEGLRGFYNWIVLDTPPVGAVAEALILAPISDGVVVVAGAEMVPRNAVRNTLDRVAETGARILGVALNRVQVEKHAYYYGHYGHYYGRYDLPAHEVDGGKVSNIRSKRVAR